ncbi:MAG: universal stress protein [Nitrospirota bacterium]|nr:universal stress protein [Nitrospirota bacterium]
MKFERILFPTDFSDHAAHAQKYAVDLARQYKADLHVIHVVQLFSYVVDFGMDNSVQYEAVHNTLQKMMDELLESLADEPFSVTAELVQGSPITEIVRAARDDNSDLIVLGTHGRTALEHALLGSVAEKVVRKAPCPVLTVRMPGHSFKMP